MQLSGVMDYICNSDEGNVMRKILFTLSLLLFSLSVLARETQGLDAGWQFVLSDASIDELSGVEGWRTVDVPHFR